MSDDQVANPKSIISVVLLPEVARFKDFYVLSRLIKGSEFHLDDNHIPHITLIQFKADASELSELKKQLDSINNQISELVASGINFVSDLENNLTWAEILIQKSEALQKLQASILSLSFAKNHEIKDWGIGDQYRPHITLGVVKGLFASSPKYLTEYKNLENVVINVSLEVGENGEYYSFVKPYSSK